MTGCGVGRDVGRPLGLPLGLGVGRLDGLGTIRFVGRCVGLLLGLGIVGLDVGRAEGLGTILLVGRDVVALSSATAAMYSSMASRPARSLELDWPCAAEGTLAFRLVDVLRGSSLELKRRTPERMQTMQAAPEMAATVFHFWCLGRVVAGGSP